MRSVHHPKQCLTAALRHPSIFKVLVIAGGPISPSVTDHGTGVGADGRNRVA